MGSAGQRFHQKEHHACHQGKGQTLHVRLDFGTLGRLIKRHDSQADPHGKGIEGTDVRIIPFTRLQRRLVEIHNDGNARHQKQQAHDRSALGVSEGLEGQSYQPKDQRQVIEVVQSSVVLHVLRQRPAISKTLSVDEIQTTQPISIHEVAVTLNVILFANEIPKEVPEVHPTHLVIREKPQVLTLRWDEFFEGVVQTAFSLQRLPNVVLVSRLVCTLGQPSQIVLLCLLLSGQPLHVALACRQSSFKLAEHQCGHTCPLLAVAQNRSIHLTRLRISHQHVVFALKFKVGAKTLVVIGKQPPHHALKFLLRHA